MFCMCFAIGCVGSVDSKIGHVCVLKEGTFVQGMVSYVVYKC